MDTIEKLPLENPQTQQACAFSALCPTRLVLNRIADKWTVLVVILLQDGTKRFSHLQRQIDGISQKMLTQTLRGLERDGLVRRKVYHRGASEFISGSYTSRSAGWHCR